VIASVKRSAIGLGDLIRAAGALQLSDDELAPAARLLGLLPAESAPVPRSLPVPPTRRPISDTAPSSSELFQPRPPRVGPGDASALGAEFDSDEDLAVDFVGTEVPPALPWLAGVEQLAAPARDGATRRSPALPLEPLLASALTRAIATVAAATPASDGPIDLARLIDDLVHRRPLRALPRLPAMTLRRGAHVLVDRAAAMQPFQADADDLAARIQRVASHGVTRVLYFDGDPTVVDDTWPVGDGRPYELPAAGTPLVAITDLGIRPLDTVRRPARPCWAALARKAWYRRCPVVAFVPYPASRWPTGLGGGITPVLWDRRTTVAALRAARRHTTC
jgi:hypothetical protein